ncbi:hypothetical protein BH18THE2_BH18THE2_07850 [soil metagenome]
MTSKRQYNRKQRTNLSMVVLVTVAGIFSIFITLPNTPQIQALGDSQSTQTSCINNQPCQTVVCSETQPCRVSQSPNTDFDEAENTVSQPLEGTGTMGLAPSPGPYYYNDYWEDHQEYLEERQDMIEDGEYE